MPSEFKSRRPPQRGRRPTGGHHARTVAMRVRFSPVPLGSSSSGRTPDRQSGNPGSIPGDSTMGNAQGAGRSPKPASQGSSPWLPAAESEHGWAMARPETCASPRAFGSIPTPSSVEDERGWAAHRPESGRDPTGLGIVPSVFRIWKVNAAGPRAVSKADGALGLGVRFARLPRRVARTVRGRLAKPRPVVVSPEQVRLLHSPLTIPANDLVAERRGTGLQHQRRGFDSRRGLRWRPRCQRLHA